MSILVCGSIAFDTIMVFPDQFKRHILAEKIHILNVAFLVPEMRREFGGCAGNIAYNLHLLGAAPRIMPTVGHAAGPYRQRLTKLGLDQSFVQTVPGTYTAQAFITTDLDDNQITAFHPGAMSQSHLNRISDAAAGIQIGIVSPDGRDGMLEHSRDFKRAGIPFIFDPGQGLPMFSGEELLDCLKLATWCTVNDYEAQMICDRTGLTLAELAEHLEGLIVTLGAQGSKIFTQGREIDIPCVTPDAVTDPTGCGDAYRAGLLYALSQGWALDKAARLASVMGAIKVAHRGGQNHSPDRADIAKRYLATFGELPW